MRVYLDNAATTALLPEVQTEMIQFMKRYHGNPSSTHWVGREARVEIEKARKKIASVIGAVDKEIIFTSGGTEANNYILKSLVLTGAIERIISSPIEHHSVLDSLDWISKYTSVEVHYFGIDKKGSINLSELEELLTHSNEKTLVSLMHGNNEIGNLLDLKKVGELCHQNNAFFHTDMVQTLAHYPINLTELPIDFASASAHKIHGPKGVGFLYVKEKTINPKPFLHGGAQERELRGGTENTIGIIGMAKSYESAYQQMGKDTEYILGLKKQMIEHLNTQIPNVEYNGMSGNLEKSMYSLLNIQLPIPRENTLLFNLDLKGVAVSEGSACSSGANEASHVLKALGQPEEDFNNLRISFSKLNTDEEINYTAKVISEIYYDLLK